jgi:excinuclease UvrABC helicase subunit UvrB
LEDAGITQDQEDAFESDSLVSQDDDDFDIEETVNDYSSSSMEDLEKQLQGALEQEDYELASKLRDEIKKRNP